MTRTKILRHIFRFHGIWESFKLAGKGVLYLFLFHRNMRLIFMLGIAVFLLGLYLKLKGIELIVLCITITLVFMAEIFNTAIEMLMNMLTIKYHIRIKLVKDIAAAVVLLASLNAVAVGYVLFFRKIFKPDYVFAQTAPTAAIERSQEILEQDKALREQIEKGQKTFITKIIVQGVTLLAEDQIREIITPLQDHWLTRGEIQAALDSLKDTYARNGYPGPAEVSYQVKGGSLTIKVQETKR